MKKRSGVFYESHALKRVTLLLQLVRLEGTRNRKRRELFDAQDAIDAQRDELIGRIEKHLHQRHTVKPVFAFRWRLV